MGMERAIYLSLHHRAVGRAPCRLTTTSTPVEVATRHAHQRRAAEGGTGLIAQRGLRAPRDVVVRPGAVPAGSGVLLGRSRSPPQHSLDLRDRADCRCGTMLRAALQRLWRGCNESYPRAD